MIKETGRNGAELIAFSEAFISTYLAYYTVGYETNPHEWTDYMIALQDNSLHELWSPDRKLILTTVSLHGTTRIWDPKDNLKSDNAIQALLTELNPVHYILRLS